jgi:hypothetical protein
MKVIPIVIDGSFTKSACRLWVGMDDGRRNRKNIIMALCQSLFLNSNDIDSDRSLARMVLIVTHGQTKTYNILNREREMKLLFNFLSLFLFIQLKETMKSVAYGQV